MNLKNKVFGFVAAAALTLSMVGGAAATDSAHGSVQLSNGTCSASITESSVSFGTWTYNGQTNHYVPSGNTTSSFDLNIYEAKFGGKCSVQLEFSGLILGSQNIGPAHFSGSISSVVGNTPLPSGVIGPVQLPGGNYSGSLTLNTVPQNYEAGTYEGDITVRVLGAV